MKNNAEIKYFSHEKVGYRGELKNIIPLVIGLDKNNAKRLVVDCLDVEERKKEKRSIKNHPCIKIFLEEIKMQLLYYKRILADKDPKNYREQIDALYKITAETWKQKYENELESTDYKDLVFKNIKKYLEPEATKPEAKEQYKMYKA